MTVTTDASALPSLFPSEPSCYPLTRLAVIRLTGADRVKYLQSQVTCDVSALQPGQQSLGAHCDAKGKMWDEFRLLVLDEALLLLTDRSLLERSLPELKKYGVFSKVTIEDASAEYALTGIAGAGSDAWIEGQFPRLDGTGLLPDGMAVRIAPDRWLLVSHTPLDAHLPQQAQINWWGLEILAGLPHMRAVHQGEYIPQMLNLQALDGICFSKGCYMGQETVARAKYRGANNRGLFVLCGSAQHAVQIGESLEWQLGPNWKRSGQVLDCWQQDEQVLISAVLPLDTESNASFRFKGQTESQLQLLALPYSLGE
jgi:tRNA-modifying protein YgfZ